MCILERNFSLENVDMTVFVKAREFNMQVCEEYASTWYDDSNDLKQDNPSLAEELVEEFGDGEWQENQLFVYESVEDFAYYELTEGWYIDNHLDKQDYNGAPDPIDYIDLEALGEALVESGDESCIYRTEGDQVVTTDCGWS